MIRERHTLALSGRALPAVSSLGDVLELIFATPDPGVSVHAVVHEQHDREVAERVGEQFMKDHPGLGPVPKVVWLMAAPVMAVETARSLVEKIRHPRRLPEPAHHSELTVWLDASGRARLERTWQTPGGRQRLTSVVVMGLPPWGRDGRPLGPRLAGAARATGTMAGSDRQRRGAPVLPWLLREIVACLELETPHEGEVAGRPVVVVRALRRRPDGLGPHWLPFGAESYELSFDREFGSLLAFRGGMT